MPQPPSTIRLPNYTQDPRTIPLGEWLPDQPDFNNPGSTVMRNVYPLTQSSYGPIPSLAPANIQILPDQPFGLFSFLDRSGTDHLFTGTLDRLYHFHTGELAFADVTQDATTYNATAFNPWSMTGFGNSVIATNGVDEPQVFAIDSDTRFTDLQTNKAPRGHYTCVVRDFLFMGNVLEPSDQISYPQRVHWCAIGNPANWPALGTLAAAELESDAQDLRADLGWIRGLASGLQSADIAIFMDNGVYTGIYVGSPAIFSFQVAQGATGCRYSRSIVVNRGYAYYLGLDGFYAFDGVAPHPIGAQKIDRWFFHDPFDGVDAKYIGLTQGAADPTGRLILWLYCGPDSNGTPNRMLVYNWSLDRWSMARVSLMWIGRGITPGYSLDQLDQFGTLDTLPFSLDSPAWQGGNPLVYAFDQNNQIGTFSGPNLAATIETLEGQPIPGRRSRLTSVRPIFDGSASPSIAVGSRNRLEDPVGYASAVVANVYGECPQRVDARYMRARLTIPGGTTWKSIQGVEIDFTPSTRR